MFSAILQDAANLGEPSLRKPTIVRPHMPTAKKPIRGLLC